MEDFYSRLSIATTDSLSDLFTLDENIPFHATRLLLLIRLAGRPITSPRIEGRTKLAKLDFFIRYPRFLDNAARLLLSKDNYQIIRQSLVEAPTVESHMVRYRYGPWDRRYYLVLAYLHGKGLIGIHPAEKVDQYRLTESGYSLASRLMELEEFTNIVTRCKIVGQLFGDWQGTWVKRFIYRNFPEVVRTPHTHLITDAAEENDGHDE